jgi:hypothetical protein
MVQLSHISSDKDVNVDKHIRFDIYQLARYQLLIGSCIAIVAKGSRLISPRSRKLIWSLKL